ncbi:MAG: peptide chain release factor N(5)-glutamine methyltransferase [Anaerolineae bacterium]
MIEAPVSAGESVRAALQRGAWRLRRASCDQPRLDAELLLACTLHVDRASLLAHPERSLSAEEAAAYEAALQRRAAREPLAYITGMRAFHGLELLVDARVLVPRPETEMLVERALTCWEPKATPLLWDVGTGSGAIALAVAAQRPGARVVGSDVSAEALAVAACNRCRLGLAANVRWVRADLLSATRGGIDGVLANLPYLSATEYAEAMPEVSHYEPRLALEAGPQGLELVERLCRQAAALEPPPAVVLLEIGALQGPRAVEIARAAFPHRVITLARDLAGWDRVLEVGQRPSPPAPLPEGEGQGEGVRSHRATMAPPPLTGERESSGWRHIVSSVTHILPASPEGIALAAAALQAGEVVALPTDTVYGIGAAVFHQQAVQALYDIKGRPEGKAIPLLLADAADLPQVASNVPPCAQRLIARYWPGALTLVLLARPTVPAVVRAGGETVAVRVPDDAVARALIRAVGAPLATTSANLSGQREAHSAREVLEQLGARVRWVLDGGESPGGIASTVLDLTVSPPLVRRQGALSEEAIRDLLED